MRQRALLLLVIAISIISLLFLSGGISHAYFSDSKVSKNALTITTGNVVSNITYNPDIQITLKPFSDEYASKSKTYEIIKINNTADYSSFYTLVTHLNKNTDALINFDDIRLAVYEMNKDELGKMVIGPVSLSQLPIYEVDNENNLFDKYTINFGSIGAKGEKEYAIKAWIDINQKDAYRNTEIMLDFKVEYKPLKSKSFYNIKGIITDVYGNPLANVKVFLQNGDIVTTSNENGEYALSNVPTGIWNIIAIHDQIEYKNSVKIQNGSEIVVEQIIDQPYRYQITGLDSIDITNIDEVNLSLSNNEINIIRELSE